MAQIKQGRRLEKVLFWAMMFAMGVFIYLLILGLLMRPWLPEEVAFVLGIGFAYLMANKLFFILGYLSAFLNKIALNEVSEEDKLTAMARSGADKRALLEDLTHFGIASIWLDRYESYRYIYLGLYLLLGSLVIVMNLELVASLATGSIVEGFFWGVSLVSVFVFAADVVVHWQYAQTVVTPIFQRVVPVLATTEGAEMSELKDLKVASSDAIHSDGKEEGGIKSKQSGE